MGLGAVRKWTGAPNRKDAANMLSSTSDIQAITPPKELQPPTIDDAAGAAQSELQKLKKQRGRASTIFSSGGDSIAKGLTAKATLGV